MSKLLNAAPLLSIMHTTPDRATIFRAAECLGMDEEVVRLATSGLLEGRVVSAIFSGKMGSGKDTLAERVSPELALHGVAPAIVHRTSDPIRAELNAAIGRIISSTSRRNATTRLVDEMSLPKPVAAHIVDELFETTRAKRPTAEERTNVNRHLLQYIADEGRRSVEPEYWTRQCFTTLFATLAQGRSAFLSGGRYPNEVLPAQSLGIMAVRIEVSREVQIARLVSRDGIAPDLALLDDPNECSLDNFVGFNLVVNNDDELEPTLAIIRSELVEHGRRLAS